MHVTPTGPAGSASVEREQQDRMLALNSSGNVACFFLKCSLDVPIRDTARVTCESRLDYFWEIIDKVTV